MLEKHQLRDCQAWKDDNLELSTTSNEAAKNFDLAIHQYVGWYEDINSGGMKGALAAIQEADPNFLLAKMFIYGGELMGTGRTIRNDKELAQNLSDLKKEAEKSKLNNRERMHIYAIGQWADGNMFQASRTWEDILVDHPRDILALKMAHDTYFYLGKSQYIRDSIARVIPVYKRSSTYYGFLRGMYAFGLEETNFYAQAAESALEALSINKNDGWAAHALAHVYEMEGKLKDGEKFLQKTNDDWVVCGFLACHMYWHWCLLLIEEGRYDEVLALYDNIMHQRACSSKTMLDLVDTTSLLYRLELEGVNVGDRWQDIYEICRAHMDDHVSAFNDIHILFSICGMKKKDIAEDHVKSLRQYTEESKDDNAEICRKVGLNIYEAINAYSLGEYDKTIDLMLPIREEIIGIGGSHAQRDVFNQLLIHAAMNSTKSHNWKLARSLLYERKAQKNSPLTDRLLSKLLSAHVINDH